VIYGNACGDAIGLLTEFMTAKDAKIVSRDGKMLISNSYFSSYLPQILVQCYLLKWPLSIFI